MRLLVALAAMAFLAPAAASAQEWKDWSSQECRCSASFPGTPQPRTQTMRSNVGSLEAKLFGVAQGDDYYVVMYVDYPKDKMGNPDQRLDSARDLQVSNVKGKLTDEKKITMNGFPGREMRIDAPGDLVLTARSYIVKERVYQTLVVMPKARENAADAKKFLESFKFQK